MGGIGGEDFLGRLDTVLKDKPFLFFIFKFIFLILQGRNSLCLSKPSGLFLSSSLVPYAHPPAPSIHVHTLACPVSNVWCWYMKLRCMKKMEL